MVLPDSHRVSRVPWYSGSNREPHLFRLQGFYLVSRDFPVLFAYRSGFFLPAGPAVPADLPLNPIPATPAGLHRYGLGSSPFARRYSGNRCCFLFLGVLRCFSSPGSLRVPIYSVHGSRILLRLSCLIRTSPDLCLLAAPRSFSQLSTSFFGSWHQGIHRMPLVS